MIKTANNLINEFPREYAQPYHRLSLMEKKGEIFSLKRGLYETDKDADPFCLAAAIASPSYISFETALSYYDLIPERAQTILSATFSFQKTSGLTTLLGLSFTKIFRLGPIPLGPDFSWGRYSSAIGKALRSFGLSGEVVLKEKNAETGVSSAFVAEPTKDTILLIYPDENSASKIVFNQKTKIKFEVSLRPIPQAKFQTGYLEYPTSFGMKLFDPASLFAGKICAVLYRDWKSLSKGRDFYDFVFYVRKGIVPNLAYLQAEIMRKDSLMEAPSLSVIVSRLQTRFGEIDFEQAKKDVLPFIIDISRLDVWSGPYFSQLAKKAFEGCKNL
jgi:hypothetical protein